MNAEALNALDQVVAIARERAGDRIPVVGVAGPQGSGKTTLVAAHAAAHRQTAHFSLDDVYLPAGYRRLLAQSVHPLFETRGPPGTHNILQFNETLDELLEAGEGAQTFLPAFDKIADNPVHAMRKPVFRGRPSVILVDGWCLGALPQAPEQLAIPVNDVEAKQDAASTWRREINDNLAGAYQHAFARLDAILYLRAPSFAVIHDWRCQQEEGLLGRALNDADRQRVGRFIAHFERITRHMMDGGRRADIEVQLDDRRNVTEVKHILQPLR
ncbi:MAG: kinase [Hyphomonadaceae bacterium]|jgi:D-glycerate 3-kinase|nr:kinase [Hyphomonadaceae bacterium]